jgi:hypothetical protein
MKRTFVLLSLLLVTLFAWGEDQYSDVTIKVLKEENGKPVRNASVVLHSVDTKGKQGKGGINLKTDSEGKTGFNSVSYGTLRVQVIAQGLQTFGDDYEIKEPQKEILIKLKAPQDQYSIYDKDKKEPEKKPQ